MGQTMKIYLDSLRKILNDTIKRQDKNFKVILVTQPEYIVFVLLESEMVNRFKKILSQAKNEIEE